MRFPWLQVDADFIAAHAGDLGAHLGISRREAIGLAVDLWTWALARASDDAPPDGVILGAGPVPDRLIAGSVGWTGPAEQLTTALVACGLAVKLDAGYRLTGFSRYRATWEKNRRRTGGKPERNRTGTGEEPARKTQTQTQIEERKEDPSADADPVGKARALFAITVNSTPQHETTPNGRKRAKAQRNSRGGGQGSDPRHAPLIKALVALGYPFRGGRDAKAVKDLLALADQREATSGTAAHDEILRRGRIGLARRTYPACKSLTELHTHWGHYGDEERGPPARGPAPPSDFSDPAKYSKFTPLPPGLGATEQEAAEFWPGESDDAEVPAHTGTGPG